MKLHKWLIIILILIGFFLFYEKTAENGSKNTPALPLTDSGMKITSSAFKNNSDIPAKYTCEGDNVNPELNFSDVPEGAKALALIVHDPDAPRENGWTHWIVFNMAPDTSGIPENGTPASGIQATPDFGSPGYGGPCPPSGKHRYFFYLYALDTALDLDSEATRAEVEAAMEGHIMEKTELVGLYQKQTSE